MRHCLPTVNKNRSFFAKSVASTPEKKTKSVDKSGNYPSSQANCSLRQTQTKSTTKHNLQLCVGQSRRIAVSTTLLTSKLIPPRLVVYFCAEVSNEGKWLVVWTRCEKFWLTILGSSTVKLKNTIHDF